MGGGDEERTTPASRRRTRDMPDRAESGAQAASKALNLDLLSGDDSKKFIGVSRRKQEQLARGDEESSKKQIKYESMTTGADGIMDIPELEEEGREDLSNVVGGVCCTGTGVGAAEAEGFEAGHRSVGMP